MVSVVDSGNTQGIDEACMYLERIWFTPKESWLNAEGEFGRGDFGRLRGPV